MSVTTEQKTFADLLRRYRNGAGLTQQELAERSHLSVQAVSSLEREINLTPRRDTVELLADALNLSAHDRAVFISAARRHRIRAAALRAGLPAGEEGGVPSAEADDESDSAGGPSSPALERHLPIGGFLGALPESQLVAREAEVARLTASIEIVRQGAGRLVLLSGETGVGKTRLAQEVMLEARSRAFLVASGSCYEPQQTVPYYPFLEALTRAYGGAPEAIQAGVPKRWPELAHLLPELELEAPARPHGNGAREEQQRLFWQVTGFLRALAADRPLAVLLDDLQWADGSSLLLLEHVARHTRDNGILLLGTYREGGLGRDHPLEGLLRDLTRERLVDRVQVSRLSADGTRALIAATMGEHEVPAELAQLLHDRTEGNPFFTQEVLRELIDRGDVYRGDGRWEVRTIGEIAVPDSVRSVIAQRLMHLAAETQEALHEASVLGQVFSFEDLQAMSGRDELALETVLEEAAIAGLVRETDQDAYAFNHGLTRQALYADLPTRKRRRLHLAAAEALERAPERERNLRAADLLWHLMEARASARALPYALQVGDRASAVYAHTAAERYYRMAVELARELDDRAREADALERLGTVLRVVGRHDEALHCLDSATTTYRTLKDLPHLASATAQIGWLARARGAPEEGLARLLPVVRLVDESGQGRQCAWLFGALAELYFATGQYEAFSRTAERVVAWAHDSDDALLRGMAEQLRGRALLVLGNVHAGSQAIEDAIQNAQARDDLANLCVSLTMASLVLRLQGRSADDTRHAERACLVARRLGDPLFMALASCNRAMALWHIGEWEQAHSEVGRARGAAERVENAFVIPYVEAARGILALTKGEVAAGRTHLEEALTSAEHSGDLLLLRQAHAPMAEWELLQGRAPAARARLLPLVEEADQRETFVAPLMPLVAWAELELGNEEQSQTWLDLALEWARERQLRLVLSDAARVRALRSMRHERWTEAADAAAEALSLARASSFPYGEAKALYVFGQLHAAQGHRQRARETYASALAICARLGEGLYRPLIERALADLTHETLHPNK